MLTVVLLGLSTLVSILFPILWSIVFFIPQFLTYRLYHMNGNGLTAFLPRIQTSSYVSNDEPLGWVLGWTGGFYLGYLSLEKGTGKDPW